MAGKWSFQYWNSSAWTTLANVTFDHVMEELNGSEEAVFNIPNTAANRTIIASNVLVNVLYNGSIIYPGLLTGAKYTSTNLQCYVYNPVFVALKQATATLTKVYTSVAANSILADIVACTSGVSIGSCPSTAVSLTFSNTNAFDALVALAKGLGLYYWGVSAGGGSTNGTINIGTRDATTYTPTIYEQSTSRGIDRSKQYSKVIINGVSNSTGQPIQGTAGSGGAVKTFTDKKTSDVATLNALAAYKLLTLNNPSTGNPLSILTDTAAAWHPGQYVTVSRSDLNLVGTLIIQRITKGPVLSTVEVDIPVNQDDVYLQDVTGQTTDLGIQPISTGQVVGSLPTSQLSGSLTAFGTMSQGNDSAKPAAGVSGRIYWAVDTNKIYLDTGSTWQFIGSSVLGTLTGTISTGALTGSLTGFSIMAQGLDASKPSAGTAGRIYYATDTNKTYLDTGSAWSFVGTPLLGTMGGSITASQISANAVIANAIAANAVTANAIAAGSISASHLSAGCVTANALAAGAVTATAIAANTITASQITTAMMSGLTLQSSTTSNNGTCYVLMGHYTDADKTDNYNLIVVGEQLRFYTPTAGSDVSSMHAMGVLTASSTTFSIGITGSYSTGILQLSGGIASGGGINLVFGSHGVLQLGGSAGTSGYVLTSQGVGSPPIWSAVSGSGSWNGGTVANATTFQSLLTVSYSGLNVEYYNLFHTVRGNFPVLALNGVLSINNASSVTVIPVYGPGRMGNIVYDCAGEGFTHTWYNPNGNGAAVDIGSFTAIWRADMNGLTTYTNFILGAAHAGGSTSAPRIFSRNDSVTGVTIQLGASGQRFDVVDYAWTKDLLLVDQSGNLTVYNAVYFNNGNCYAAQGSNTALLIQTAYGNVQIGPQNGSYMHFTTDRSQFYFDHMICVNGIMQFYATGARFWSTSSTVIQCQDSTGALGVFDCSTLFADHINSASGSGIYFFDAINSNASYQFIINGEYGLYLKDANGNSSQLFGGAFWGEGSAGWQNYNGNLNMMTNGGSFMFRGSWGGGAVFTVNSGGTLTLSGSLYMSGNGSGYLWNNGGYARWTGGNGIISDGYLVFAWNGSGGAGSALYVNSSRQICQGTSSAHFKTNIEEISDAAWIYKLHPIKFDWKDQETHKAFGREIGLIAEDMLELEPLMTFWNDGNCTPSIMYEKLAVPMLVEMKKLHSRIEDLESQLTKLKAQGGD